MGVLISLITLCCVMLQLDMAPFEFLRGYAYLDRVAVKGSDDIVCADGYLTQADFNTICLEATAELESLGYVEIRSSRIPNRKMFFRKLDETGNPGRDSVQIAIGDKYDLLKDSYNLDGKSHPATDWVSVRVIYHKPKNHLLEKAAEIIAEQARD